MPAAGTGSLPRRSRRTTVTTPSLRSRGPISTRTGTPFSSQSVTRRPKPVAVWSSTRVRMPAADSSAAIRRASPATPSSSRTTRTTTCTWATFGGTRRPASSPWHMMSPPIIRVVVPHEVVQQCSSVPVSAR